MGCNASKNKVHIVGTAPTNSPSKQPRPKSKTGSVKRRSKRSMMGSQDSLGGMSVTSENRHGSATSKTSKHTLDSGFDDSEYQNVITENSDPSKVKEIENNFETPSELDFSVTGTAVNQRLSAKDKERVESQRILAALHEEGLIQKPMAKTTAGVSFEVVAENTGLPAIRPPARLAKLEKRKKKKKKAMTQEEIEEKLARAEQRRKEREQERLERIQDVSYKSDVQNALDSFQQHQQAIEHQEKSKQDLAAENREKRLREMRDKLKAKQARVEAAKRRKQLAELDDSQEYTSQNKNEEDALFGHLKPKITEETVIKVNPNPVFD